MAENPKPFYERHRWKAVAAIVALVGGVWAFSGAPSPWQMASDLTSNPLPASNTMVVLDASASMARPFGEDSTRREAALSAVERFTLPIENEGLALRTFGGSCKDSGRLVVDFGADHGDDVLDASEQQRPAGQSNLVNAVRKAIDDFKSDRFPDSGPRRIVVFAGSMDECAGPSGGDEIRDEMEHAGVDATFKFVGLDLGGKGRKRLLAFKEAIGEPAEVAFVNTESDLPAIDEWIVKPLSRVSECADGVDNDGDTKTDADDPECAAGSSTEAPDQQTDECTDELDNDEDGLIDGNDPECASGTTEAPQPVDECTDELDNDEDGLIDGSDPECASGTTEAPPPPDECADELDNDEDGRVDADDPGCAVDGAEASG
jgi:VWA domain-containing protein